LATGIGNRGDCSQACEKVATEERNTLESGFTQMNNGTVWWYVFALAFVITGLAETFMPIRALPGSTLRRWSSNSILLAVSSVVAMLTYQFSGIALAFSVQADAYGR